MPSWIDAISTLLSPTPVAAAGRPARGGGGGAAPGFDATRSVADFLRLETARRAHYSDYDLMDAEAPEAHRALDVFADTAAHGEGDGGVVNFTFKAAGVEDLFKSVNRETGLFDRTWSHIRATRKMGDHMAELVFDTAGALRRVKDMPAREMRRQLDPYGLPDPFPWRQYNSHGDGREFARFREWQIVHWGDIPAGEVYGHKRSQLAPARKPWRALEMATNSVLAERVLRTGSRLAFMVDVTGLSSDEALTYLREVKREYARTRSHDSTTGKRGTSPVPGTVMDDVWFPWTAGGPQKPVDVIKMGGEALGSVDDLKFLYSRYLSSLEVPRYMMGIDEDLRSRSATSFIDAAFVRAVVRCQQVYLRGQCAVLDRALYAAGFEAALRGDRSSLYTAEFESLKLADEKLRWDIELIKAQVARVYGLDLGVVTPEFVLTYFLGLEEEDAAKAAASPDAAPVPPPASAKTKEALERMRGADPMSRLAAVLPGGWEEARRVTMDLLASVEAKLHPVNSDDVPPDPARPPTS